METALDIKQVLREAALEALKEYRKEEREKVRKGRLRNTRLLMDNYLEFVDHYDNIKSSANEVIEDIEEGLDFDNANMGDIIIQSIKRTKVRTKIMIRHIETVVDLLKKDMEAKNESEKYKVIELLYMDESKKNMKFNKKVEEVASELNCGESTVRRYNTEMIDKLAIKLFGVDGLKLEL
ncbi:hypothetical protein [Ruminiclostridium papyrosolvens]|uniref:Uncharacterized protein n=1 Tax=Ruminiclostridium papyrosolvens C7 TaxID=1330534 RepID=U4R2G3_9FIRM|nr:hypothetical protein [Ruminiclostridium papyrosolvens]EPR12487.1 hypothetical protein L323_08005 [Ruminiclostridium papyrosolvens C7]